MKNNTSKKVVNALEQAFNFPTVEYNGVVGLTVYAENQNEAEEKVKEILNSK